MPDPLSDVIQLLRPRAVFSKGISGSGRWAVRYSEFGQPGFCAVTEGRCRLTVEGEAPVALEAGDFVLLPATPSFTMSGFEPAPPLRIDPKTAPPPDRELRYGRADGPADVRQVGGWFSFGAPDAALFVSLLPRMIHIRGIPRLTQLVRLVGEEAARDDIGRPDPRASGRDPADRGASGGACRAGSSWAAARACRPADRRRPARHAW